MAYVQWYMPRHFHALRLAHRERFPASAWPLIVCINHPSWWDPLTILMLSRFLAPDRFAHAPMEAEALEHYGFFRRIGAFPVDNRSNRAAAQFLRQAQSLLRDPKSILWMTPEGHFTDARKRPIEWKPGTAALVHRLGRCTFVPLAIEYAFWDERLPEILCSVGVPVHCSGDDGASTDRIHSRLQSAMTAAQDELTALTLLRDSRHFTPIFSGDAGVSIAYDLWLRLKSALRGKPYVAEHGTIAPK
jgi:1-acyl-sn-glycerol-3-phosphate acyltransferase